MRRPWKAQESAAVFKHLSAFVNKQRVPGKEACEKAIMNSNGQLDERSWKDIKYYVNNVIAKSKKR